MQVNRCITDILKLCKEFCLEMSKEDISDESLKAMIERLDLSVSMLMSFITLLGGKAEGLRLLLLRLDYNRFFSLRSSWTQTRHSCQVNHSSTQEDVLHSVYSRSSEAVDMKQQYQAFSSKQSVSTFCILRRVEWWRGEFWKTTQDISNSTK